MTPDQIHRASIAGIIATQLEGIRGCGCCSDYLEPVGDQTAVAQYAGVPVWALIAADILVRNGVKL